MEKKKREQGNEQTERQGETNIIMRRIACNRGREGMASLEFYCTL
jgi:hypothetical protein